VHKESYENGRFLNPWIGCAVCCEYRLTSWSRNPVQESTLSNLLTARVSLRYDEPMLIGYARVSTHEQNLTLQTDALKKASCRKIIDDRVSGAGSDRPGLKAALEYARERDTLLIWRLDRLGGSLKDLIEIIGGLEKRGIGFRSLQESIDTTTSGGRLIFHVFGALAEFERNLIRERTQAGLEALAHEDAKAADRELLMA